MNQLYSYPSESARWTKSNEQIFGRLPPVEIFYPSKHTLPFVFSSPHSGSDYPQEFLLTSQLDPIVLRRSEDSFVDELFSKAPNLGAPLLRANFPRAYVDPNREAFELDPNMFGEKLPEYVNTDSSKVSAGLGTIARVVSTGRVIYKNKLSFSDAQKRLDMCYFPYHKALNRLIEETLKTFSICFLIDCHSMPSVGGLFNNNSEIYGSDIVLGDNHGKSCMPKLTSFIKECFTNQNMLVSCNEPYSGGYTTIHYGKPSGGVHALQIEISRSLYMDEASRTKHGGFAALISKITEVLSCIKSADWP